MVPVLLSAGARPPPPSPFTHESLTPQRDEDEGEVDDDDDDDDDIVSKSKAREQARQRLQNIKDESKFNSAQSAGSNSPDHPPPLPPTPAYEDIHAFDEIPESPTVHYINSMVNRKTYFSKKKNTILKNVFLFTIIIVERRTTQRLDATSGFATCRTDRSVENRVGHVGEARSAAVATNATRARPFRPACIASRHSSDHSVRPTLSFVPIQKIICVVSLVWPPFYVIDTCRSASVNRRCRDPVLA